MDGDLAIAECRTRVAGAGSDLYYAALFLPEEEKHRLFSLHALAAELAGIPCTVADAGVARIKLAWWQEEISQLTAGGPRHPITIAIAASGAIDRIDAATVIEMTMACATWLDRPSLTGVDEVLSAHAQFEGLLWQESARLLGVRDSPSLAGACRLGGIIGVIHTMQRLGEILPRGIARLPEDLVRARGLSPEAIVRGVHDRQMAEVAEAMAGDVRTALRDTLSALPSSQRDRLLPLLILAGIANKTLDEMQDDGFRLLERRVALTPLRKLWTAIATRHHERR